MKIGDRNINAEIITDTVSPSGKRITTFLLNYPRFIHSELMTHRLFSRNARSSRAVPVKVQHKMIDEYPAHPEEWGANNPGMQSKSLLGDEAKQDSKMLWNQASKVMLEAATVMSDPDGLNCHKQIANRLLEPFATMAVIVTATDWDNFFALRAHADAQPEFQVLAFRMLKLYLDNKPDENPWHIPFGDRMPANLDFADQIKVSVARCARLSYINHGGDHSIDKDVKLHDMLLNAGHMSPFEHIARYLDDPEEISGNFVGWHQYRKDLPNECRQEVDLASLLENKPDHIHLDVWEQDEG